MKTWMTGIVVFAMIAGASWGIVTVMDSVYASSPYANNSSNLNQQQNGDEGCACCGTGGDGTDPSQLAADYYYAQTGDSDIEVVVEDFGCHQEADILKDGNVVMRVHINGDQVTEI
jgi:hypothetical protein